MIGPTFLPARYLPDMVSWVADVVVHGAPYAALAAGGDTWPQGDEGRLRELGEAWADLAAVLNDGQRVLQRGGAEITLSYGGTAGLEFLFGIYDQLGFGGGEGGATELAEAALEKCQVCYSGAVEIQYTRFSITTQALVTAISVMWSLLTAWLNPASPAVIGASLGAGRTAALAAFRQMLRNLANLARLRFSAYTSARLAAARAVSQLPGQTVTRVAASRGAGALASSGGSAGLRQRLAERFGGEGLRRALRQGGHEIIEEAVLVDGLAQAWQMALGDRDAWNFQQTAISGLAGFLGGAGSTLAMGERSFLGLGWMQPRGPGEGSFLRQFATQSVTGGLRNGISSPMSSYLATQVVMSGQGGLPGLLDSYRQGLLPSVITGAARAGGTLTGSTVGQHFVIAHVDPSTGVLTPRTNSALDINHRPDRASDLRDLQLQTARQLVESGRFVPHLGTPGPLTADGLTVAAAPSGTGAANPAHTGPSLTGVLGAGPGVSQASVTAAATAAIGGPSNGLTPEISYTGATGDQLNVTVAVRDADGTAVGSITRVFGQDAAGQVYVEHVSTLLATEAVLGPGGEVDQQVLERFDGWLADLEAAHQRAGVQEVRIDVAAGQGAAAAAAGLTFPGGTDPALPAQLREALAHEPAVRPEPAAVLESFGVDPGQASPTTTALAETLVRQHPAAAADVLARIDATGGDWQPTPQHLLGLGHVGAMALQTISGPAVKQLGPPGPTNPAADPVPAVDSPGRRRVLDGWLGRREVVNRSGGPAESLHLVDGQLWLADAGAPVGGDLSLVGPVAEAREIVQVFAGDPGIEYAVRFDGLIVQGAEMAQELLAAAEPAEPGRPHPGGPEAQTGGSIRPRIDADAFDWAEQAYDRFRASDADVADIARNLASVRRPSGRIGFTAAEIAQIKHHLMVAVHRVDDYDGGLVQQRFDANPAIAEAWIRLREGRHRAEDLILLEHELVESDYLRAHPDATYREAHDHSNQQYEWDSVMPGRTGEDLATSWGGEHVDGDSDLLQAGPGGQTGGRVQLRVPGAGPPAGGPDSDPAGPAAGRQRGPQLLGGAEEGDPDASQPGPLAEERDVRGVAADPAGQQTRPARPVSGNDAGHVSLEILVAPVRGAAELAARLWRGVRGLGGLDLRAGQPDNEIEVRTRVLADQVRQLERATGTASGQPSPELVAGILTQQQELHALLGGDPAVAAAGIEARVGQLADATLGTGQPLKRIGALMEALRQAGVDLDPAGRDLLGQWLRAQTEASHARYATVRDLVGAQIPLAVAQPLVVSYLAAAPGQAPDPALLAAAASASGRTETQLLQQLRQLRDLVTDASARQADLAARLAPALADLGPPGATVDSVANLLEASIGQRQQVELAVAELVRAGLPEPVARGLVATGGDATLAADSSLVADRTADVEQAVRRYRDHQLAHGHRPTFSDPAPVGSTLATRVAAVATAAIDTGQPLKRIGALSQALRQAGVDLDPAGRDLLGQWLLAVTEAGHARFETIAVLVASGTTLAQAEQLVTADARQADLAARLTPRLVAAGAGGTLANRVMRLVEAQTALAVRGELAVLAMAQTGIDPAAARTYLGRGDLGLDRAASLAEHRYAELVDSFRGQPEERLRQRLGGELSRDGLRAYAAVAGPGGRLLAELATQAPERLNERFAAQSWRHPWRRLRLERASVTLAAAPTGLGPGQELTLRVNPQGGRPFQVSVTEAAGHEVAVAHGTGQAAAVVPGAGDEAVLVVRDDGAPQVRLPATRSVAEAITDLDRLIGQLAEDAGRQRPSALADLPVGTAAKPGSVSTLDVAAMQRELGSALRELAGADRADPSFGARWDAVVEAMAVLGGAELDTAAVELLVRVAQEPDGARLTDLAAPIAYAIEQVVGRLPVDLRAMLESLLDVAQAEFVGRQRLRERLTSAGVAWADARRISDLAAEPDAGQRRHEASLLLSAYPTVPVDATLATLSDLAALRQLVIETPARLKPFGATGSLVALVAGHAIAGADRQLTGTVLHQHLLDRGVSQHTAGAIAGQVAAAPYAPVPGAVGPQLTVADQQVAEAELVAAGVAVDTARQLVAFYSMLDHAGVAPETIGTLHEEILGADPQPAAAGLTDQVPALVDRLSADATRAAAFARRVAEPGAPGVGLGFDQARRVQARRWSLAHRWVTAAVRDIESGLPPGQRDAFRQVRAALGIPTTRMGVPGPWTHVRRRGAFAIIGGSEDFLVPSLEGNAVLGIARGAARFLTVGITGLVDQGFKANAATAQLYQASPTGLETLVRRVTPAVAAYLLATGAKQSLDTEGFPNDFLAATQIPVDETLRSQADAYMGRRQAQAQGGAEINAQAADARPERVAAAVEQVGRWLADIQQAVLPDGQLDPRVRQRLEQIRDELNRWAAGKEDEARQALRERRHRQPAAAPDPSRWTYLKRRALQQAPLAAVVWGLSFPLSSPVLVSVAMGNLLGGMSLAVGEGMFARRAGHPEAGFAQEAQAVAARELANRIDRLLPEHGDRPPRQRARDWRDRGRSWGFAPLSDTPSLPSARAHAWRALTAAPGSIAGFVGAALTPWVGVSALTVTAFPAIAVGFSVVMGKLDWWYSSRKVAEALFDARYEGWLRENLADPRAGRPEAGRGSRVDETVAGLDAALAQVRELADPAPAPVAAPRNRMGRGVRRLAAGLVLAGSVATVATAGLRWHQPATQAPDRGEAPEQDFPDPSLLPVEGRWSGY